jgi:tetratricopeptide (TPR) repeat protein
MAFGGDNAESYYDEGLTASMKGDLEQAISYFEQAIRKDNSLSAAYHQLGKCYLRYGNPQKATSLLQQVVKHKPRQVPPRLDLGFAYLEQDLTERAREIFKVVSNEKPDNGRATLGLAHCAFQDGQWAAAATLAQTALNQAGANFAVLYLLGRASKLAGTAEGYEALKSADHLLEKSIESSPNQPEGYYLRGEVCFVQDDFPKALDHYRAAETRAEAGKHYATYGEHFTHTDILARQGLCHQRIGNGAEARKLGEKIISIDADHKIGKILSRESS